MPQVLGVAGGTCSGKSTLANRLADALKGAMTVKVIGLDAFYTRDMERGPVLVLSDGATMFNFNDPGAIDAAAAVHEITTCGAELVIVEGLFTFAIESIRALTDRRVFVHLDADLRAIRRLLRDMKGGRASTDPEFIARYYIECARVGHARFVEPSRVFAEHIVVGDDDGMAAGVAHAVKELTRA